MTQSNQMPPVPAHPARLLAWCAQQHHINVKQGAKKWCVACKGMYRLHAEDKDYEKTYLCKVVFKPISAKYSSYNVIFQGETRTIGSTSNYSKEKRMDLTMRVSKGTSSLLAAVEFVTTADITADSYKTKIEYLTSQADNLSSRKSVLIIVYNHEEDGMLQLVFLRTWLSLLIEVMDDDNKLHGGNSVFELSFGAPKQVVQAMSGMRHLAWNAVPENSTYPFLYNTMQRERERLAELVVYVDAESIFGAYPPRTTGRE